MAYSNHNYQGFTLIEVMVSWLLLSLGLLGLLAFETKSLQDARAGLYQSLAQTLLNDAQALMQLKDNTTINSLQTQVAQLLPQGKLQDSNTNNLTIQWRLPEVSGIQQLRDDTGPDKRIFTSSSDKNGFLTSWVLGPSAAGAAALPTGMYLRRA